MTAYVLLCTVTLSGVQVYSGTVSLLLIRVFVQQSTMLCNV